MTVLYLVTAVVLMSVFAASRWLVGTKTGRLLVAIRDGENRLRFLGYSPAAFKTGIFVLSAGLAILVNGAKTYLSESFPNIWLYFLGSLFIAITLLFPDGAMGLLGRIRPPWWEKSTRSAPGTPIPGLPAGNSIGR